MANQPVHRSAKFLEGAEGFDANGQEEHAVGVAGHGCIGVVAAAGTGQSTGQRLHQHRQPKALVASERPERPARLTRRLALAVDDPPLRQERAGSQQRSHLAFGRDAGGNVEQHESVMGSAMRSDASVSILSAVHFPVASGIGPVRDFATLGSESKPKATPWPRRGRGDNLIDARASSYCFWENYDPEPQGSCIQKRQCLDRAPKGALGRVLFFWPCRRGSRSGLGLALLFFPPAMSIQSLVQGFAKHIRGY